jgi:hypothetical protein
MMVARLPSFKRCIVSFTIWSRFTPPTDADRREPRLGRWLRRGAVTPTGRLLGVDQGDSGQDDARESPAFARDHSPRARYHPPRLPGSSPAPCLRRSHAQSPRARPQRSPGSVCSGGVSVGHGHTLAALLERWSGRSVPAGQPGGRGPVLRLCGGEEGRVRVGGTGGKHV